MESKSVARMVGVLYRQSLTYMHHGLKDLGITPLECIFLVSLFDHEGANQEQLSSLLVIDKSATTKAMKSLENKGFVTRNQCRDDKRAKRIYTTSSAQLIKEPINAMLQQWVAFLTHEMEAEGIELTLKSLNTMVDRAVSANHKELLHTPKRMIK